MFLRKGKQFSVDNMDEVERNRGGDGEVGGCNPAGPHRPGLAFAFCC